MVLKKKNKVREYSETGSYVKVEVVQKPVRATSARKVSQKCDVGDSATKISCTYLRLDLPVKFKRGKESWLEMSYHKGVR